MDQRLGVRGVGWAVALLVLGAAAVPTAAAGPPKLEYGFQNGRQYVYDVKIVADLPDEEVTRQGSLTYHVLSTAGEQFTLRCTGMLGSQVKSKAGRRGGFPFGPPGFGYPRPPFGPFAEPSQPEGATFNRQGELVMAGRSTDLPYLLGKQEMLLIEPLSKEAKTSWRKELDLGVVERDGPARPFGPFAGSETNRGAKERSEFSVAATEGDTVQLAKKYSLKTAPEADGTTRIDMTGSGRLAFDLKEGVFRSLSMKYEIRVNENRVQVTIPVTVDCRLLAESEVAERQKQAATAAAAAAEANRPKPLAPGEREQLLKDLASRDDARIKAAAQRLSKAVADDNRAEISRALVEALGRTNEWIQAEILAALRVWVTPDAEPAVIEAAKSKTFFVRDAAIGMLGNFKTAESVKAAAEAMLVNRHAAADALKAIGPTAEGVTIPLLEDRDFWVRGAACDVLAEIGGKTSLRALKELAGNLEGLDRHTFDRAIAAVEKRVGSEAADEPAETAAPAEPGKAEVRTWRDVTGTYSIEASLLKFGDGTVTLKKVDGRTITLPLGDLSAEDQAYVEKQAKPKPRNPFE